MASQELKDKTEKVLQIIKNNGQLTDEYRKFVYEFLNLHGEQCCGQKQDHADPPAKKRKIEPQDEKCPMSEKAVQTIMTNVKDVETNCDMPVFIDFDVLTKFLDDTFKVPREQWTEAQNSKFLTCFRMTYPLRRLVIVADNAPTAKKIQELYPYLFHRDQVFMEFEFVTKQMNLLKCFKNNVKRYSSVVWQYGSTNPLKKELQKLKDKDEDSKDWIHEVGSLLLLPHFMDEERKGIIIFKDERLSDDHENRPYIQSNGDLKYCVKKGAKFVIYVDEAELCTVDNMIEAYLTVMAAYYIFNAVYPDCAFGTFTCLERLFVEYTDQQAQELEEHLEEKIKLLHKHRSHKNDH